MEVLRIIFCSVLLATSALGLVHAADSMVVVDYPGVKQLSDSERDVIRTKSLDLLKTSNFNSRQNSMISTSKVAEIQKRYRNTIRGHFILVSSDFAHKVKTVGGEIDVSEIVIGLNRSDYADALFTIDSEDRVVEHGKYMGANCIELLNLVKSMSAQ